MNVIHTQNSGNNSFRVLHLQVFGYGMENAVVISVA
jgi:hypothetical protein